MFGESPHPDIAPDVERGSNPSFTVIHSTDAQFAVTESVGGWHPGHTNAHSGTASHDAKASSSA